MTLVMGILNVTPDSFSDGGLWDGPDAAVAKGIELAEAGARFVDVGGESTRPGAARVSPEEEARRVVPVIEALAERGIWVSVDTMRASTARAASDAGAVMINDVSGGLADPAMAATVAELGCDYVCMHWRAHSPHMDARDDYTDVVAEVRAELASRVGALTAAGIPQDKIILDPGLGFSKVGESNWPLLANIAEWSQGHRVLIGASRKRFLGAAIQRPDNPSQREHATTAVTTLAAASGAWGVRVHDVTAARDALAVLNAWENAKRAGG